LRAGQTVSDVFQYSVSDGTASASASLTVSIAGANDAPVLAVAIADQAATGGQPFSFSVSAGTFSDADQGEVLAYSATRADGGALPAWLAFDAATRSFSGTPANGDAGTFSIRVTATDPAGANASDAFDLVVTAGGGQGVTLVGTAGNDTLTGTEFADSLDGRAGSDTLRGLGGDDTLIYSVDGQWGSSDKRENVGSPGVSGTGDKVKLKDRTRTRDLYDGGAGFDTLFGSAGDDAALLDTGGAGAQLVGIERIDMGAGDDVVDLTSRRFAYGNVTIVGGTGDDVLWSSAGNDILSGGDGDDQLAGGAGNDVLAGDRGDDSLQGGAGNDTYVYELHGGDDTIRETGGSDTLLFGAGITPQTVDLSRHGNDLVVRVAGSAGGKLTIEDWFKSSTSRIERIQFADGTTWNIQQIGERVDDDHGHDNGCSPPAEHHHGDDHDHDHHGNDGRNDRDDGDHDRDRIADAIAQRLGSAPRFDFEALIQALGQSRSDSRALTPAEIARRWSTVQGYAGGLGENDDGDRAALLQSQRNLFAGLSIGAMGWGYDGSTGQQHAPEGFQTLQGLNEGLKKL
jgi:Ca2+-binding RTX toxin-like protein